MGSLAVLTVVAPLVLAQDPVAKDPTFAWPPICDRPLRYTVKLAKHRELSDGLAKASRQARLELELDAGRAARQSIQLEIDVALRADDKTIDAAYETRLVGRPRLRWQLAEATASDQEPALGNDRLEVWGQPDDRRAKVVVVPRNALERAFAREFRRGRTGGARPADIAGLFGDHLLPVIWDRPLPCWIGQMADVIELAGEAAVEGKTLIRDASGSFPLGHRETRVELAFTTVSGSSFTFTYAMTIRQVVAKTRDLKHKLHKPWEWHLAIDGEATYRVDEQAFERVRETIAGVPRGMDTEQLARIRDQAFTGTIEVSRTRDAKSGKPRRQRGR